jgi:hypothetical protein
MTLLKLLVATALGTANAVCMADDTNTFHVVWDMYSSETGYFKILECGDEVMPTIGMKRGITYTFDQTDPSNWYHAIGFSYFPDGAHKGVDELEPTISQSGGACADDASCQAPMYFKDGAYVGGTYDGARVPAQGGEDFGLDVYEPEFFFESALWEEAKYTVQLTLTDEDYEMDMFYFCHIHNWMSARIKQLDDDGNVLMEEDMPELGYEYQVPSDFDMECGTYGIGDFTEESGKCEGPFVCTEGDETPEMTAFGECLYAMDCHMNDQMRSILNDDSPVVTFIHQMIPHHQNAVNMAKALLKTGFGSRRRARRLDDGSDEDEDETPEEGGEEGEESEEAEEMEEGEEGEEEAFEEEEEEDPDADMVAIAHSIINVQNFQIHQMQGYLEGIGAPATAYCSGDDPNWHKRGDEDKHCDWVGEYLPVRCYVKGEDGSTAWDGCMTTCAGAGSMSGEEEGRRQKRRMTRRK